MVGVGIAISIGVGLVGKFTEEEGSIRVGDFTLVCIDREGTTGKYQRTYLWANHPHGAVLPIPGRAAVCLALPTIGSDIGIGGTGMIKKGGGAFEVNPPAATGCWAFTPAVGGSGVTTCVYAWNCLTTIGRDIDSRIDYQIGSL